MTDRPKPKWWRLYAIVPVMIGLLLLEAQWRLSSWEHKLAQLGIVLFALALVVLWSLSNLYALVIEDSADDSLSVHPLPITPVRRLDCPKHDAVQNPLTFLPSSDAERRN